MMLMTSVQTMYKQLSRLLCSDVQFYSMTSCKFVYMSHRNKMIYKENSIEDNLNAEE